MLNYLYDCKQPLLIQSILTKCYVLSSMYHLYKNMNYKYFLYFYESLFSISLHEGFYYYFIYLSCMTHYTDVYIFSLCEIILNFFQILSNILLMSIKKVVKHFYKLFTTFFYYFDAIALLFDMLLLLYCNQPLLLLHLLIDCY